MVPGPLMAVGPMSAIEGEVMMIDPGVMMIELAPHISVIIASAMTVSVIAIVALRFMSTVKESFIITVTDLLFWIVSAWSFPTVRV